MGKTKVFLALGEHDLRGRPANVSFFRDTISPILDQIDKDGTRGIIVHEVIVGPRLRSKDIPKFLAKSPADRVRAVARLDERVNRLARGVRSHFEVTLDIGEPDNWFGEWGFEQSLLSINKRTPGRIRSAIEPQATCLLLTVELSHYLLHHWVEDIVDFEGLKNMAKARMFSVVTNLFLRDCALTKCILDLAAEDPQRAIIVPRGYSHIGIYERLDLYHSDIFEISLTMDNSKITRLTQYSMDLSRRLHLSGIIGEGPNKADFDRLAEDAVIRAFREDSLLWLSILRS
jgi:hypothetical protein